MNNSFKFNWPDKKKFAFSIFDDTDFVSLPKVKDIYSFLSDCNFRFTKSVWPMGGKKEAIVSGATCEDPAYLKWLISLQEAGYEMGYHMTTYHSSSRSEIIAGLERFHQLFHHYPFSMANHVGVAENIYWGDARLTGVKKIIYNILTNNKNKNQYYGHVQGSPFFWGDLCKQKIKFVRNFIFPEINTLKACPFMPYYDPQRPYVRFWFASSEGSNADLFNKCINEKNQDRLEEEGGACIIYTHLASEGFWKNGVRSKRFRYLMSMLSQRNGWFVPVSTLLDYVLKMRGPHNITDKERNILEWKWLWYKIRSGAKNHL
jgi:hypothetical protein